MRVLISGSLGFIGRRLQPALKAHGHTVLGFDAAPPSKVDVTDYEWTRKVVGKLLPTPDIIIHLAANTSSKFAEEHPRDDFKINVHGTLNMLEIAREYGSGFIYPSTYKVTEDKEGRRSPYGMSKYIGELLCNEWRLTFGLKTVINRISNLYGAGEGGDKFWVNLFIKKMLTQEPVEVWGDGTATRDMLYIDDLIALFVDQVEHFDKYANGFYNVSGLESLSIKQLLNLFDYKNVIYKPALKGDKTELHSDNTVSAVNDWQPHVSLADGIHLITNYYEEAKNRA